MIYSLQMYSSEVEMTKASTSKDMSLELIGEVKDVSKPLSAVRSNCHYFIENKVSVRIIIKNLIFF